MDLRIVQRRVNIDVLEEGYQCNICGRRAKCRVCVVDTYGTGNRKAGEVLYYEKMCIPCLLEYLKRVLYGQDPIDAVNEMREGDRLED